MRQSAGQAIDDAGRFLDAWGALAVEFQWPPGELFDAAAKRAPALRLMLFDLPAVAERARARLADAGLLERASILWRQFPDELITGRGGYYLAHPDRSLGPLTFVGRAPMLGRDGPAKSIIGAAVAGSEGILTASVKWPGPGACLQTQPVRRRRGTKAGQASTRKHAAPAIRGSKEQDKPRPKGDRLLEPFAGWDAR